MQKTTFEELYQPLILFLTQEGGRIDKLSKSRSLYFCDFVKILIFHFIYKVETLRSLVTELQTNPICEQLGLSPIAFSTLKDGFTRFKAVHFKHLYQHLLAQNCLEKVPELNEYGLCHAVDGSLFPSIITATWASYKKTKNAIRLHVDFSLNHMAPIQLEALSGKSCERSFLKKILQSGITYIADRGYFSFELGHDVISAGAYLVFRVKANLLYTCQINRLIEEQLATCFKNVTDQSIKFNNDPHQQTYRLITFDVENSHFRIVTNRFDLSVLKIIILYAYRWQIELLFKFIKRTLKGIHLLNHSPNGTSIQFYMLMIVALLQLHLKQKCIKEQASKKQLEDKNRPDLAVDKEAKTNKDKNRDKEKSKALSDWKYFKPEDKPKAYDDYKGADASTWINVLGRIFRQLWKISKQWTIKLKNFIAKPFDQKVIEQLSSV